MDPNHQKRAGDAMMRRGISRRAALQRLAAAAGPLAAPAVARGQAKSPGDDEPAQGDAPAGTPTAPENTDTAAGSLTDPDLIHPVRPWKLILSPEERRAAAALCDAILPADGRSPAASAVGVPEFIDEWISAPYPDQEADRAVIRGGLGWLNTESTKRFGRPFSDLRPAEQTALCDDICDPDAADPKFRAAAAFFDLFRDLTTSGFYTTPDGFKDLGYVGNVPLPAFPGPPPDVLKHLGLE